MYCTVSECSFIAQRFLDFLECLVGHFNIKAHLLVAQYSVHQPRTYESGATITASRTSCAPHRRIRKVR